VIFLLKDLKARFSIKKCFHPYARRALSVAPAGRSPKINIYGVVDAQNLLALNSSFKL
jgi:hypothetical protein